MELSGGQRPAALLIANPHAAGVTEGRRELVAEALSRRARLDVVVTEHAGHGREIAARAADSHDLIITLGGDGTINEAVNGLGAGSPVAIFPLPGGSANVLAKMLGIPGELVDATGVLLGALRDRQVRVIDLAAVNGRLFTFCSGIGLDAAVVERVDARPAAKRRLGPWFFAATAVGTFARRYARGAVPRLALEDGTGTRLEGLTAVIQNGRPYTYFGARPIELSRHAHLQSGSLAGAVLTGVSPLAAPALASRALTPGRAIAEDPRVAEIAPARELTVRAATGEELPLHVDGDFIGRVREARYKVLPRALRVLGAGYSAAPGVRR
jgi:diacylglycerol kinase family enzyme